MTELITPESARHAQVQDLNKRIDRVQEHVKREFAAMVVKYPAQTKYVIKCQAWDFRAIEYVALEDDIEIVRMAAEFFQQELEHAGWRADVRVANHWFTRPSVVVEVF